MDKNEVIQNLYGIRTYLASKSCEIVQLPKEVREIAIDSFRESIKTITCAVNLLQEQKKEIKALRLLIEWAEECDFGFDQFPYEYNLYKNEIKDMRYTDGMIHVAKRTLEDHGAFEER